jgi:LysR family hydrogen peroxide-inducible transcriptional activator
VVAPALRQAYPKLDIVWTENQQTEVLVEDLQQGRLEAAIVALEADLSDLVQQPLGKDEFVLAVAHSHRLAGPKGRIAVEELAQEDILLLDDGHCLSEQALSFCSRTSAKELGYRATRLATLTEMVAAGAGVTLLPTLSLGLEARGDRLATRRFKSPAPARTLGLVWRRNSVLQPVLKEAAKTLAGAMR